VRHVIGFSAFELPSAARGGGPRISLDIAASGPALLLVPEADDAAHLVRACLGLRPVVGTLEVLGTPVHAGMSKASLRTLRRRVGTVLSPAGLLSNTTLRRNIALPAAYAWRPGAGRLEDTVSALVELCGITSWADVRPAAAPASVRQRAAIARALAINPELLLLERPDFSQPAEAEWFAGLCAPLVAAVVVVTNARHSVQADLYEHVFYTSSEGISRWNAPITT
jgi:ABC-type transporter Mla maintaining outer membrane lipid asymmetry ATPase subunit MlaF